MQSELQGGVANHIDFKIKGMRLNESKLMQISCQAQPEQSHFVQLTKL